jgi:hypothetical protein
VVNSIWRPARACSVIGAAHQRQNKPCQDASLAVTLQSGSDSLQLMAVADGHGGSRYHLSHRGSALACAVAQQVGIGLAIGFTVRLVFSAVELAGEVVGFQMGLNFAAFFNPSLNTQSSAVATFFGQMATFLFIVMNGHLMVLMAVTPVAPPSLAALAMARISVTLGVSFANTGTATVLDTQRQMSRTRSGSWPHARPIPARRCGIVH